MSTPKSKRPEQYFAKKFMDTDDPQSPTYLQLRLDPNNEINEKKKQYFQNYIKTEGGPKWVQIAINALVNGQKNVMDENGELYTLTVRCGTYKVVVINKNYVCTLEFLSKDKMSDKELVYDILGGIDELSKLQVKIPNSRWWLPSGKDFFAYFTRTEYCNDVMDIVFKGAGALNDALMKQNTTLNEQFKILMKTYRILCDNHIYIIDIKPDNMLLCSDGLYFIDVDDVTILREEFRMFSFTATEGYCSDDWVIFARRTNNTNPKHQSMGELRIRFEYEGWQALIKTYFGLKLNQLWQPKYGWGRTKDKLENIKKDILKPNDEPPLIKQDELWLIKQDELWLDFIVSPDDYMPVGFRRYIHLYYEKNNDIREWLNSVSVDNKENVAGGGQTSLSSRIQLRF